MRGKYTEFLKKHLALICMASAMEKLQLQLSRFVYGSIAYVSAESLSPCFGVPEDIMAQNIGPYSEDFY